MWLWECYTIKLIWNSADGTDLEIYVYNHKGHGSVWKNKQKFEKCHYIANMGKTEKSKEREKWKENIEKSVEQSEMESIPKKVVIKVNCLRDIKETGTLNNVIGLRIHVIWKLQRNNCSCICELKVIHHFLSKSGGICTIETD